MPVNLLVFGMPEYRRDFRRYLMAAAERSGGMALHVLCKDKLVVSWAGAERAEYSANGDSNELRQLIRDRLQPGPILGLTGLGATRLDESGVAFASNLHKDLRDVHWIYDVYDDLLYSADGEERVRRLLADAVWRCRCEHSIILDPELRKPLPERLPSRQCLACRASSLRGDCRRQENGLHRIDRPPRRFRMARCARGE